MGWALKKSGNLTISSWVGKFPVLVIAHRGFSESAPENTLTAFKRAIEVRSDMIELDVRLSKEGEVVVIHDDTLDRTTDGRGKVAHHTLKELKQLDAGSWFGSQFSGEKIPTLQEVLKLSRRRILVNIELKKGHLGQSKISGLADRALSEVEGAGMLNQVLFSSFDPSALETIYQKNPRVWLALLYNKTFEAPQEVILGRPFSFLNCRKTVLTQINILRAHREGFKVMVYTLNTEDEMERFLHLEVDGIITDYPDRLIELLKKRYS